MVGNMEAIRMDTLPQLKDPLLVAAFSGWNDGGQAATSAVKRLVREFEPRPFATIDPDPFYVFTENRPLVSLVDGQTRRQVDWQKNEFSHAFLPGAGRDVVLFLGVEPNLKWRSYCENFSGLANQLGVRTVVTLGAYLADVLYTLPVQVNGFSSNAALMEEHGLQRTSYEGPTGIVGVLTNFMQERGFETLSLWGAVPYYISIPNPKAAFAILSRLQQIFDIRVDLQELEKDAENFDNEINDVVAKDPNVAAYVRELKKRDFLN